jgi:hypothetical protein
MGVDNKIYDQQADTWWHEDGLLKEGKDPLRRIRTAHAIQRRKRHIRLLHGLCAQGAARLEDQKTGIQGRPRPPPVLSPSIVKEPQSLNPSDWTPATGRRYARTRTTIKNKIDFFSPDFR